MNVNKLKRDDIAREKEERREDTDSDSKRRKLGRFKALLGPALAGLIALTSARCGDMPTMENYVPFPYDKTDSGATDAGGDLDTDADGDTDSGTDTGNDTDSGIDTETGSDTDTADTDTADTDTADTDTADTDSDTGDADTDTGDSDTDTGDADTDTGTPDGGTSDSGVTDGGTTDGGTMDSGTTDSGVDTDTGTTDGDVDTDTGTTDGDVDTDADTDVVGSCGDVENASWDGLIDNGDSQTVGGYTVIYVGEDPESGNAIFDIVCEGSNDPVAQGVIVEEGGETSTEVADDEKVIRIVCYAIGTYAANVEIHVEDLVDIPDGGTEDGGTTDGGTDTDPECVIESPICETAEPGCFDGLIGNGASETVGGYKFVYAGPNEDENAVFDILCAETDLLIAASVVIPEGEITELPITEDCKNITFECFSVGTFAVNLEIYVDNL